MDIKTTAQRERERNLQYQQDHSTDKGAALLEARQWRKRQAAEELKAGRPFQTDTDSLLWEAYDDIY